MKFLVPVLVTLCGMIIVEPAMSTDSALNSMKSKLESAISSAVQEARQCNVDVDNVEVAVSLVGSTYKIEFFNPLKRGGGAVVIVERSTARVQSRTCLQ